jgi:SAM-dependent methyltransferase
MDGAGDVVRARSRYFGRPSANLRVVVKNRYTWMNDYLGVEQHGIELGAGAGLSREFIRCNHFQLTDYSDYDWLDVKHVDAHRTPFDDEAFDFAISVNVIHHLARPLAFFREMSRILKKGGRLIVQDVHCSFFLRLALRLQRHEGYDFNVDVFDESVPCTDPDNPWAANNALVDLLFEDEARFSRAVPQFRRIHSSHSEFLTLLNSGGVIARSAYIPLPMPLMRVVDAVDRGLTGAFPSLFASQVRFVFEKV